MAPRDILVLNALGAEARQSQQQEREQLGIESGMEQTAGAVEVVEDFIGHGVEPAAVNCLHPCKEIEVGHHQHNADGPEKIHNFCQRPEVIFLLTHI